MIQEPSRLIIIGLDLATKTGWAVRTASGIESGMQDFAVKRGESPGMRYLKFQSWLEKIHDFTRFSLAVYELPHLRGAGATTVLVGLETRLQAFCASRQIEHASVHSGELKTHATGKGSASKAMMIAAAAKRFDLPDLTDDNEADALWVLDWAIGEYG